MGKRPVRHYDHDVAAVVFFAGTCFLDRGIVKVGVIAFALNSIADAVFVGEDIDAVITCCFGKRNIFISVTNKNPSAATFELATIHGVNHIDAWQVGGIVARHIAPLVATGLLVNMAAGLVMHAYSRPLAPTANK